MKCPNTFSYYDPLYSVLFNQVKPHIFFVVDSVKPCTEEMMGNLFDKSTFQHGDTYMSQHM